MPAIQFSQSERRLASRGLRFGGYALWTALATGCPLAIDRLLICPQLNEQIGKEVFGGFVWVRLIGVFLGGTTAGGLSFYLMRNIATKAIDELPIVLRSAITLTLLVSVLACVLGGGISYFVAPEVVQDLAIVLYLPILFCMLLANTELVLSVRLRMRRAFGAIFLLRMTQVAVLLAYVFFALSDNLWGLGGALVLSAILPLATSFYMNRKEIFSANDWWDRSAVRWIIKGWPAGSAIVTLDSLAISAPLILIGLLTADGVAITVFYAGTSISNIFSVPAGSLSVVVQSLLASKRTFVLHGNRSRYYFVACASLGLAVSSASYFFGLWIVRRLYPSVAGQTAEFYHWIAIATGILFFRVILRTIVVKYAAMWMSVFASAMNAFMRVTTIVILVPMMGAKGGAIALVISECVVTIIICFLYRSVCIADSSKENP